MATISSPLWHKVQGDGEFSGQAASRQDTFFALLEGGDFFFGGAQGWISVTRVEEDLGISGSIAAQLLGVFQSEDRSLLNLGGERSIAAVAVFSGVNGECGIGCGRSACSWSI